MMLINRHPGVHGRRIAGWVENLDRLDPHLVVVGHVEGDRMGPFFKWLKRGRRMVRVGPWRLSLRRTEGPPTRRPKNSAQ
jgi:hypothetical protein